MKKFLIDWLNTRAEQIRLLESEYEIIGQRFPGFLQLSVQLTQFPPDKSQLQAWMQLGGASLNHFRGALAQAPSSGELWLIQCLHADQDEDTLLDALEALLNQRDSWRALYVRLSRPRGRVTPTSLRPMTH